MAANAPDLNPNEGLRSDSTASNLLAAAKRNDPQAWKELVERYSWLIVRWCLSEGLSIDDAPDVVQAVLMQVSSHLAHFQKDRRKAAFRRWLRTITRSQIANLRRAGAEQPRARGGTSAQQRILAIAEKAPLPSGSLRLDLLLERFWNLVERVEGAFETSTWQAFWLTTFEGLTSTEAAKVLGITPAAVRLAKARVLRRIRDADADLADELKRVRE